MKYRSDQGFTHPILSPESGHYPDGKLNVALDQPTIADGNLRIAMEFELKEPYLESLIAQRQARCAAMLYCSTTLYQTTLQAPEGGRRIEDRIAVNRLRNNIDIHPIIVAAQTIELDTQSAHPFYHGSKPVVRPGEPLAMDLTFAFSINSETIPIKSIFEFIADPELEGPMKLEADPQQIYARIRINAEQYQKLHLPGKQGLTIPTIFASALGDAVRTVMELEAETAAETPNPGWVNTIRKQARNRKINLQGESAGPFEIAQALLDNPFNNLDRFQLAEPEEKL